MSESNLDLCPKVTVAVLSWNRLHYLRATLESARLCIQYPNIEWIISDNESEEPGLREYIESLDWVQKKIYRKQSHAEAMNELVQVASGKYILIWPEDVQFVVQGNWMQQLIELLEQNEFVGSVGLDALRAATLRDFLRPIGKQDAVSFLKEIYWYRSNFRRPRVLRGDANIKLYTLGFRSSGICGSGIPTLTRTSIWRELGPWRSREELSTGLVDSSGGAEVDMYRRFYLSKMPLQSAIMHVPVAADILTDPLGCKAKVRKGMRYGVYMPPRNGQMFYYKIRNLADFDMSSQLHPLSFLEVVEPIGFSIPCDKNGDRLKYPINTSVVCNVATGENIPFPLEIRT